MGSTKSGGNTLTLQQLQQQQQHILGQMQIIQQALMLGQGLEPGHIKDGLKDRQRHDSATFGSIGSSSEGSVKENRPDNNNTDHLISKNINGEFCIISERLRPQRLTYNSGRQKKVTRLILAINK